jgi:HlyD family secretion protein
MSGLNKTRIVFIVATLAVIAGIAIATREYLGSAHNGDDIVSGNGRIEATEIDVASKIPGRIREILVNDGDYVTAGQIVARIDDEAMNAQLRQAQAQAQQAQDAVVTAQSQLVQRHAEHAAALAVVAQREAELAAARNRAKRSSSLLEKDYTSHQEADDDRIRVRSYEAAIKAAQAQVEAAKATIATGEAQIKGAQSAANAATATVERIRVELADNELKAPRDGRVQFRILQPGEIIGAGGRVLNMIDLSDVYMTFFLPTSVAGRVALGSEVHLILDPIPQYVLPARVSYVADVAQFTPKTVETASEREKLMFRVKAQLPVDLLRQHMQQIKTGVPGTAYIKLDAQKPWPANLVVKLPQ